MPDLANWTQPDPILGKPADPMTLNPYAYVGGNPANAIDPSGTHAERYLAEGAWWIATTTTCGAVGALTYAVGGVLCEVGFTAIDFYYVDPALDREYGTHDPDVFDYVDIAWSVFS